MIRSLLAFALVTSLASNAFAQADDFRVVTQADPVPPPPPTTPTSPADTVQPPPPDTKPKPVWELNPFGYVRIGYDHTMEDARYEFVGRNNGFILDAARVGLDGRANDWGLTWRIAVEGAADVQTSPNTPIGSLSVRLRDAIARWDPIKWIGVQAGQFKAPFQEEELRGTNNLMFVTRAVGIAGVLPGRGIQTPGIQLDRQVGVMLSPGRPIGGDLAVTYYAMVMNGNGQNQLLDDNGKVGFVARSEVNYLTYVKVGAALFNNDRTVGTPPNLYNEEDLGLTGDVAVKVAGLDIFGSVTRVHTVFPTVGTSARVQLAWHAQAAYKIELPYWFIAPAYRYAYFHPWQEGGDENFDAYRLTYHTFGIKAGLSKIPVVAWLNYTLTTEGEGRKLDNDRIELLGQVTF
jgi:hypothetical protein